MSYLGFRFCDWLFMTIATPDSTLDRWLADLGFVHGNPFANIEADRERALLPKFFIKVGSYERIQGDNPIVVFAPRGGGKSAFRVMLASQAAPRSPDSLNLAVEYTNFDSIIVKQRTQQRIYMEDHLPGLFQAGVRALLEAFGCRGFSEQAGNEPDFLREARFKRALAFQPVARSRLAQMIHLYDPEALTSETLYETFQYLDTDFRPAWDEFVAAVAQKQLKQIVPRANPAAHLLAELSDVPVSPTVQEHAPTQALENFRRLAEQAGFTTVQFLVDRLDERAETVDNPEAQVDILESLLAHLPVLEMRGLAFKFFVSQEAREAALKRPMYRRDRLLDQEVTVNWSSDSLKRLLKDRLDVYSQNADGKSQIVGIAQLCESDFVAVGPRKQVALGEWLEEEMIVASQNSPRLLLTTGRLLFEAHIQRAGAEGLLTEQDWHEARRKMVQVATTPRLRLNLKKCQAWIGSREFTLTPQECRLLRALADHPSGCEWERLIELVWNTSGGVSNETVLQTIKRLRDKLGDDAHTPVYLQIERGQGCRLTNFEIAESS